MRWMMTILMLMSEASALCVVGSNAVVQRDAVSNSKALFEAIPYMPLKKLGTKSGWYKVEDFDGKIGWIRERLATSQFKCAMIKEPFAILRTGPASRFPKTKAGMGEKYLSFRLSG